MITSRWVHGNIVNSESPIDVVIRRGWGTHFGMKNPSDNWFHFPLATLCTVENRPIRLLKIYVLFRTDSTIIRGIDVYDGPIRVASFVDLDLTGDHTATLDPFNCWSIYPPVEIEHGIGISVGVEFTQGSGIGIAEILFTAAGIEVESP